VAVVIGGSCPGGSSSGGSCLRAGCPETECYSFYIWQLYFDIFEKGPMMTFLSVSLIKILFRARKLSNFYISE